MNFMKYKLIVSDFDGTLTNRDGTVPKENIDAIRAYTEAGGLFTVSTGRMHSSILKQLSKLGLADKSIPLVSYQGALITDSGTGTVLHSVAMNRGTVRKVIAFCQENGYYCHYYSFDRFFIEKHCETSRAYAAYTETAECAVETGGLLRYLDEHPDLTVCKTMIIESKEKVADAEKRINEYLNGEAVFARSAAILTECVDGAAGKGNAVKWLSGYYGIPVCQILAAGDSWNDESMIKTAGLGVAMGNADDALKKIAGYVADSAENAGLAKLIQKVLKGEL